MTDREMCTICEVLQSTGRGFAYEKKRIGSQEHRPIDELSHILYIMHNTKTGEMQVNPPAKAWHLYISVQR